MPIDYSRYPPNWKTEIVPAILKRANNKCEFCGVENGRELWSATFKIRDKRGKYKQKAIWFTNEQDVERIKKDALRIKKVKVVLTVAHLDHDEENHNVAFDRLRALCQYCHLNYDAEEKYRRLAAKWGWKRR